MCPLTRPSAIATLLIFIRGKGRLSKVCYAAKGGKDSDKFVSHPGTGVGSEQPLSSPGVLDPGRRKHTSGRRDSLPCPGCRLSLCGDPPTASYQGGSR